MDYFANFGFVTGELSPRLMFRSDLEKYDFGIKKANNFFVDYRGGVSVRPPMNFRERMPGTTGRLIPFRFNLKQGNTLIIGISSNGKMYFFQNGNYILNPDVTVLSVTNSIFSTDGNHGFTSGDVIKITGSGENKLLQRTMLVVVSSSSAFSLTEIDGTAISVPDATYANAVANTAYSISHSIPTSAFRSLNYDQFQDDIYLTDNSFYPLLLSRLGNTNWTLNNVSIGIETSAPTIVSTSADVAGNDGAIYAVTAVSLDGEESVVSNYRKVTDSNNITSTAGAVTIAWNAVSDADYYNVYRSIFYTDSARITIAQELGYLGRSQGLLFFDNNIIPDFTSAPPTDYNPFASGAIRHINVTAGGTGYTDGSVVTVSGGTGFDGRAVVNDSGNLLAILIIKGGEGFTDSSVVSVSGGTGATFDLNLSPAEGNFPAVSYRIQQRRYYFGTEAQPMQTWASKISKQNNFALPNRPVASDAFTLPVDSPEVTPIKYVSSLSDNLMIFMASQVSTFRGADDQILAPGSIKEDTLTTVGIGDVPPIRFEDSILYVAFGSTSVQSISPTNLRNYFRPDERSIFSNHLFKEDNPVVAWASMPSPHRIICGIYANGKGFIMTYVPEQNVYGFTRMFTNGTMIDIAAVKEDFYDYGYVLVDRGAGLFLERFDPILINSVEDLAAADSYLQNDLTKQTTKAIPVGLDTIKLESGLFTNQDQGKHIRLGNGRALVTDFISSTEVKVKWELPATELNEQTGEILATDNWTMDPQVTAISALWHLEGREVAIVVDGSVQPKQTVTDGKVSLQSKGSFVMAGLDYDAEFETLPFTAADVLLQARKKSVKEGGIFLHESRGLFVAAADSPYFYEMKERRDENYGIPTTPLNGMYRVSVQGGWDEEGGVKAKKSAPLLASILGVVASVEVGDDS